MDTPPITKELARRIEKNDIHDTFSRPDGMRRAEGNPLQIEIWDFDYDTTPD